MNIGMQIETPECVAHQLVKCTSSRSHHCMPLPRHKLIPTDQQAEDFKGDDYKNNGHFERYRCSKGRYLSVLYKDDRHLLKVV